MIARHHDYLLRIPTVPAGGLKDVPLTLDSDAPFALRLVRSRNIGISGWNFQTPRRAYQSLKLRTDLKVLVGGDVSPTKGSVIYPQMIYPVNGSIVVDIGNTTGEAITDAQLLFRGSKLFPDGSSVLAGTYPPALSPLTFTYPKIVQGVAASGDGSIVRDNMLQIDSDADFVIRCGVCDPFTLGVDGGPTRMSPIADLAGIPYPGPQFKNVYVQLMDEARKLYSNVPIHINDLFGQGAPINGQDLPVVFMPGLFTPEFYVPANHSLYFDVYREDDPTDPTIGATVDLNFRFCGSKVFWR